MIVWTHANLGVLYACVLYFCIHTCSVQLSMFHMERFSRNTLIIIIIIIIITIIIIIILVIDRLVGLVVRRPPPERKISGSNPACDGIFSGSSHTSDLKIGTLVATLPGAWRCRVSTGTGRPGVSIL